MRIVASGAGGGFDMLDGAWKYKIERIIKPTNPQIRKPAPVPTSHMARGLYNGMIAPVLWRGIRGAIWYQGESDCGDPRYGRLLAAMIGDWQTRVNAGAFPFFLVQLAGAGKPSGGTKDSSWARGREQQLQTWQSVPNTGMAVAIDLTEHDCHPRHKRPIGERLARIALAKTYAKDGIVYSGPIYRSMRVEEGKVRLFFDHVGGGLVAKGGPLKWFAVAGANGHFVSAKAVIDDDSVVVSSPAVPKPTIVRYAWALQPVGCNLYNKAGLPASPFRTDSPRDSAK